MNNLGPNNIKVQVLLFFLIFLSPSLVSSQSKMVTGIVKDNNNSALRDVNILADNVPVTSTDSNGFFSIFIDNDRKDIQLKFTSIGYSTLDTFFDSSTLQDTIFIILNQEQNIREEISIVASGLNSFKENKWKILDYDFLDEYLIAIYLYKQKRHLGLFDINGNLINKVRLHSPYKKINISCSQTVHLTSAYSCLELNISNIEITPIKKYNIDIYENLVEPCVFKLDTSYIFKNMTNHNKKAIYFSYNQDKTNDNLYTVHDKKAEAVTHSHYLDIISYYYREVGSATSVEQIDYGVISENIIENGEWSGDLIDLWIDNDIHPLIAYYLDVASNPISTFEYSNGEKLHVVDFLNQEIQAINPESDKIITYTFEGLKLSKFDQLLYDQAADVLYTLNKDLELLMLRLGNDKKVEILNKQKVHFEGFYPRNLLIHNGRLFYLTTLITAGQSNALRSISL